MRLLKQSYSSRLSWVLSSYDHAVTFVCLLLSTPVLTHLLARVHWAELLLEWDRDISAVWIRQCGHMYHI